MLFIAQQICDDIYMEAIAMNKVKLLAAAALLSVLAACGEEEASTYAERTADKGVAVEQTEVVTDVTEEEIEPTYTDVDVAALGKVTLHKELPYAHTVTAEPLRLEVKTAKLVSVEASDGAKHLVKNADRTHFVVIEYSLTNISDRAVEVHHDSSYIVTSHGEQVTGYAFEKSATGGVLQAGATKHGEINFETLNSSASIQYFTWFLGSPVDVETYQYVGRDMKLELEVVEGSMGN